MARIDNTSKRAWAAVGSIPAEWAALAFPLAAVVFEIIAFFGRYAFDDSYVGYSNALNLATGHGFAFNAGDRALTTSAPLVVPLYAALLRFAHVDIIMSAQVGSAVALLVLAAASYAVLRTFSPPLAASVGAFIAVTSPSVLLLWSHETLLWMAAAVVAVLLALKDRWRASALVAGTSMLLRPESVFLIAFLVLARLRREGLASATRFGAIAALPFAAWALYAIPTFGAVTSQSIVAKQAQLLYGGQLYLHGLLHGTLALYGVGDPLRTWIALAVALPGLVALTLVLRDRYPALVSAYAWTIVTTLLYLAVRVHFFVWFASQVPLLVAVCAAAAMRPAPPGLRPALQRLWTARSACALAVVLANLYFVTVQIARPEVKYANPYFVMPKIGDNNYERLALWVKDHSRAGDTVAYPEIGQLRYYSGRNVVDDIGLATPGVARHMLAGDTVWAFKQYVPTLVVDAPDNWHYIVDLREYPWFHRAYARVAAIRYPGEAERKDAFDVYRLRDASQVPVAEERTPVDVQVTPRHGAIGLAVTPRRAGVTALEVRVTAPGCRAVTAQVAGAPARSVPIPAAAGGAPQWVRIETAAAPLPRGRATAFTVGGCPTLALDPPTRAGTPGVLRRAPAPRMPWDAVVAYAGRPKLALALTTSRSPARPSRDATRP